MFLRIKDNAVRDAKFSLGEPPRHFEVLLRGRAYSDAPDITARMSGANPAAHSLAASKALEAAFGTSVDCSSVTALRRLLCCGEWLQGHVFHSHFLHVADFMGYDDALGVAREHPRLIEGALRIKKLGNEIMDVVGGRAVHPVNLKVGGFYRAPSRQRVRGLGESLKRAVDEAAGIVRSFGALTFPDYEADYTFVALHHPQHYAIEAGCVRSGQGRSGQGQNSRGRDIAALEFEAYFDAENGRRGPGYLVGPLARYALNFDQLTPLCKEMAAVAGLGPVVCNPFKSILVRAVETLYACEEALRLTQGYEEPESPSMDITPRAGHGGAGIEAPGGLCWHRYDINEGGRILGARIVSPTGQNHKVIEADLRGVAGMSLGLSDEDLRRRCEQAVRNHAPTMSSAGHCLNLSIDHD